MEILELTLLEGSNYRVQFVVTDQGMGLNDLDRANLFKPYFKSSSEENRAANANSNGLGLSISKKLAQTLGGDLRLTDKYRNGCQFILTMDVERVIEQRQSTYRIGGRRFGKNIKKKKIEKVQLAQVFEVPEAYEQTVKRDKSKVIVHTDERPDEDSTLKSPKED